jgi:putative hydrolase of the HAD superfamily
MYKNIYFDLDRTLWDFEKNASEAFFDLYKDYKLNCFIPSAEHLIKSYHHHNEKLWEEYRKGNIKKDFLRVYRFQLVLNDYDVRDNRLAEDLSKSYLDIAPLKTNLIPHTLNVLKYLKEKYSLHIITNGFSEVQKLKLQNSGIINYFQAIISSDSIGVQKPKPDIFKHALTSVNAKKKESIMIGDDLLVDVLGAKKFGMDQLYFNPGQVKHNHQVTYEISSLIEIKNIL